GCGEAGGRRGAWGRGRRGGAGAATFAAGGTCRDCRIAITGTATVARRAARAESRLTGSRLTPETIQAAADAATDGITFTGDLFGSAAYLAQLLPIYLDPALAEIATPLTPASPAIAAARPRPS